MSWLRNAASFARWRLIPVRYATRLFQVRPGSFRRPGPPRLAVNEAIARDGFHAGPRLDKAAVEELRGVYVPRTATAARPDRNHPFVNLVEPGDLEADRPIMRHAFSREVLDVALDYFGGACTLDSIQVLYTFPGNGMPTESQMWHKDYGDSKSFHCVTYLNDVRSEADGPFVFASKPDTRRIARSPLVRRIDDDRFARELGPGTIRSFLGEAGESVLIDPAVCYHYGSRCTAPQGRLAIFVTFNSLLPFVGPQALVAGHRERIYRAGKALRPDIEDGILRRLLMLPLGAETRH